MNQVTVDALIDALNRIKSEVGGNAKVALFNGFDYETPPEIEDCYELKDVMVQSFKSYFHPNHNRNHDEPTVFLKYE